MPPRVMLVLPTATYRAAAFLDAAAALGIDVVIVSEEAPTLAGRMGDAALTVDLERPASAAGAAVELARRRPVDAVLGVDEAAVLTAAHLAAALGIAANPFSAVAATRDKRLMRAALRDAGVEQPAWEVIAADDRGTGAAAAAEAVGLPAVVKPVDLAGSRGVIRADDLAGLRAAIGRVDALLRRDGLCAGGEPPLLVEAFASGPEIAIEGLLRGGELAVLAVLDKPDPLDGPFFAETLYVTPSRHDRAAVEAALALTRRALAAIGLREGPIHAEVRLSEAGPVFLEVAARSIGGRCSAALRVVDGAAEMTLEEAILRHACRLPLADPRPAPGAAGVLMLPVPRTGVLAEVRGAAAAGAVAGVTAVELTIPAGTAVEALPEGDRYLGFVVARGPGPAEVEATLRRAASLIEVHILASAPP